MDPICPKITKTFPILFQYIMCSLKGRCWRNLPKKAKNRQKRQILQPYNTAQFVQYGNLRVKYHAAYYTNTPYDPSLQNMLVDQQGCVDKWIHNLPMAIPFSWSPHTNHCGTLISHYKE
jgi:hypothetical protein